MVFRSKLDVFFGSFMLIVVLIIGVATFSPIFLEDGTELVSILTMISLFLVLIGFILWSIFSVKYVFHQDYLYVKGGLFRSKIPYVKITKVSPTSAIFTGYRIMSARDGIEVFYKTSFSGSVKISPSNKKEFIKELKKRCLHIEVKE